MILRRKRVVEVKGEGRARFRKLDFHVRLPLPGLNPFKWFRGVGSLHGASFRWGARLSVIEVMLILTALMFAVLFLFNSLTRAEIVYGSETVSNVILMEVGARATVDFLLISFMVMIFYIFIMKKYSVQYSQGGYSR